MKTLIIKSKIWNKSNTPMINYKDKNYIKQKITVEKTGILSRNKDKIIFKQTENLDTSNNSSENTNYMNEPRNSELISVEKRENETNFYVNCGEWSKDLMKLIDQNAVYFLYKGLTIENFLKEKQKYYALNQGDIFKLGKIYLKILHIKLNNPRKKEDEDRKANTTADKEENRRLVSSESESSSSDDDDDNDEENESNMIKNEIIKEEDEVEDEDKKNEIIKRYCSPNSNENIKYAAKKDNVSNLIEYNEPLTCPHKNINKKKKYYNKRLNRSFNDDLSDTNLEQKRKDNIILCHSMSWDLKKHKRNNLCISIDSHNKKSSINKNKNQNQNQKEEKKDKDKEKKLKKKEKNIKKIKQKEILIKPEEKKKKGKICRICLSGEENQTANPLICPCICKGSMKFIHYLCLKNWLNLKIESDLGYGADLEKEQPTITYSTKDIACELCKTKLPDYIKHKGKIYNVSFYKPKYNKFIVLESIRDDNRRTKFIHIIPLNRSQVVKIGRLSSCDLSLPDFSISRVHCCMYIESGKLYLENNSKFGTKILVQNPKLVMSSEFPLCIEVQKTYLKLILEKPFSFFSCCNVLTTSVSKMLVYQKQNEKGFDLFCSMVFKEDDKEAEEEIEEDDDNNEDMKSIINNNEEINEEINNKIKKKENKKNMVNKAKEEIKKNKKLKDGKQKPKKDISKELIDDNEKGKDIKDIINIKYNEKKEDLIDDDNKEENENNNNDLIKEEIIKESMDDVNGNIIKLYFENKQISETPKKMIIGLESKCNKDIEKDKNDEYKDIKKLIDLELSSNEKRVLQNKVEKNNKNLINTNEFKNSEKKSPRKYKKNC